MHHQDVAHADVRLDLAAGERADHELGHAEGESPHRRGADGGARGAAKAENAIDLPLAVQLDDDLGRAARRGFDSLAAVVRFDDGVERRAGGLEDAFSWHIWRKGRWAEDARVDDERGAALSVEEVADELVLNALSIERT